MHKQSENKILTDSVDCEDDEKGSGGFWDEAAEIAINIGLEFKERYPDKFGKGEPACPEDFGQEIIYNLLRYGLNPDKIKFAEYDYDPKQGKKEHREQSTHSRKNNWRQKGK